MDFTTLSTELESLHPLSYRWAVACCDGDAAEAEDVLQSTYVKILQGKAKYRGGSALKTWLFAVVRNTARELRQCRTRETSVRREAYKTASPKFELASCGEAELADEVRRLRRAIRRLSKRQQEVLHLVFYQQMSLSESADVMGVSVGAARAHYERAKEHLRRFLIESKGLCTYGSMGRRAP
jgi:RNA polymerase sigma-70 factor (ECF subfamily)